jgi:hypothetical protein
VDILPPCRKASSSGAAMSGRAYGIALLVRAMIAIPRTATIEALTRYSATRSQRRDRDVPRRSALCRLHSLKLAANMETRSRQQNDRSGLRYLRAPLSVVATSVSPGSSLFGSSFGIKAIRPFARPPYGSAIQHNHPPACMTKAGAAKATAPAGTMRNRSPAKREDFVRF